jgi:hypothetical protein
MMNNAKVRSTVQNQYKSESPDEYQRRLVSEANIFYSFVLTHSNLPPNRVLPSGEQSSSKPSSTLENYQRQDALVRLERKRYSG